MSSTVHIVGLQNLPQDLPLENKPGTWAAYFMYVQLHPFTLRHTCCSLVFNFAQRKAVQKKHPPNPNLVLALA
jgi:hypothetical protein